MRRAGHRRGRMGLVVLVGMAEEAGIEEAMLVGVEEVVAGLGLRRRPENGGEANDRLQEVTEVEEVGMEGAEVGGRTE